MKWWLHVLMFSVAFVSMGVIHYLDPSFTLRFMVTPVAYSLKNKVWWMG